MIPRNSFSLISQSPSLSNSSIMAFNSSSDRFSQSSLVTLRKFLRLMQPEESSSKNLNAFKISSTGSRFAIFEVMTRGSQGTQFNRRVRDRTHAWVRAPPIQVRLRVSRIGQVLARPQTTQHSFLTNLINPSGQQKLSDRSRIVDRKPSRLFRACFVKTFF